MCSWCICWPVLKSGIHFLSVHHKIIKMIVSIKQWHPQISTLKKKKCQFHDCWNETCGGLLPTNYIPCDTKSWFCFWHHDSMMKPTGTLFECQYCRVAKRLFSPHLQNQVSKVVWNRAMIFHTFWDLICERQNRKPVLPLFFFQAAIKKHCSTDNNNSSINEKRKKYQQAESSTSK